ncbi:MAG: AAA family ATPase [Nodosilinea sp.]
MSQPTETESWRIFQGNNHPPHDDIARLPKAPTWRPFGQDRSPGISRRKLRGETFQTRPEEVRMINAALYLRRPLLITGRPGTGKSSLAYAVAYELMLGEVLYWPITTRTTLKEGLYTYDAIGRLQEVKQMELRGDATGLVDDPQKVADYITLGPLGTALLPATRPRVLLIDEIDKSDIDLPNDLLTIFEEGRFEIPELLRLEPDDPDRAKGASEPISVRVRTAYTDDKEPTKADRKVFIKGGRVPCTEFPLVILTSNGERDFPTPFLRRCLRLTMAEPDLKQLQKIITAHLKDCDIASDAVSQLIETFLKRRDEGREQLATDQLLNALFMVARDRDWVGDDQAELISHLLAPLDRPLPPRPGDANSAGPKAP